VSVRKMVVLGLKIVALTAIFFLCFAFAALISGISNLPAADSSVDAPDVGQEEVETPSTGVAQTLSSMLLMSFLITLALTYVILRSRWTGWKLVAAVFVTMYGLMTIMQQIESLFFLPGDVPSATIHRFFVMGAIVSGLFSTLSCLILGKMGRGTKSDVAHPRLVMPWSEWLWKLGGIVVAYMILYFTFGYFLAWRNPVLQAYYGGYDPGSFFAHMAGLLGRTPFIIPFQAARALLWTLFALPLIRMCRGGSWELRFGVGCVFAVWSSQLLLPNPFMPEAVARIHLVETASSNFIFGWIVGWLLDRHHSSPRELFR